MIKKAIIFASIVAAVVAAAIVFNELLPLADPPDVAASSEFSDSGKLKRPNITLTLHNGFLKDVLGGLCDSKYQIYLGDPKNYIIFKKLKGIRGFPEDGEVEITLRLDFSVKKYMVSYKDEADATVRFRFATVKKDGAIFLQGFGRCSGLKTKFGDTLDKKVLIPRINKAMEEGPLFELPMSEIVHVTVPWPKLGESGRNTELTLEDMVVEIHNEGATFHLIMGSETTVAEEVNW